MVKLEYVLTVEQCRSLQVIQCLDLCKLCPDGNYRECLFLQNLSPSKIKCMLMT